MQTPVDSTETRRGSGDDFQVAAMISRITPGHGPHRKQSLPHIVAKKCLPVSLSNCQGTDTQKPSYIIFTSLAAWRADCCLATSNNIRNSIVACVYSVAKCLSGRCLAICILIYIYIYIYEK
jgi:hypothetical protein